jgi:hypothetical protein
LDGNEKDSVTVLASVTAGGDRFLFFVIAKGKTRRAERNQLGSDETLLRDHSPSRWSTIEIFWRCLDWLAVYYEGCISPEHPLHLILDSHSAHGSEEIKEHARSLGIQLWFILARHTDERQPLDRVAFGAIKSVFRRRFKEQYWVADGGHITQSAAITIWMEIWRDL